jgi:hypothetical protein
MKKLLFLIAFSLSGCVFVDSEVLPADESPDPNNSTNNFANNIVNNVVNNVLNNLANNTTNNSTNNIVCVPETDAQLCETAGKDCGTITLSDRCDLSRNVQCGVCTGSDECGSSLPNICGCPCTIDGECVAAGPNPNNPCQVCAPNADDSAWTPLAPGAVCDDGNLCTVNDACAAEGTCRGSVKPCTQGGECQTAACNVQTGACDYAPKPDNIACTNDSMACTDDVCIGGKCNTIKSNACLIEGTCYASGKLEELANCAKACNPGIDQMAWSTAPVNTPCDSDPSGCGSGKCISNGTCVTDQAPFNNPKNGNSCSSNNCDGFCQDGACMMMSTGFDTCMENNACYGQSELRPSNDCQWCSSQPMMQGYLTWMNVPVGTKCGATGNNTCDAQGLCIP